MLAEVSIPGREPNQKKLVPKSDIYTLAWEVTFFFNVLIIYCVYQLHVYVNNCWWFFRLFNGISSPPELYLLPDFFSWGVSFFYGLNFHIHVNSDRTV